jgi:superfamily I DNA/RNA helicase
VRETGEPPIVRQTGDAVASAVEVARAHTEGGSGTMVVIASEPHTGELRRALAAAGLLDHAEVADPSDRVSVMEVAEAKGLEFDAVIVVEPGALVAASPQGLRALYVAMTRATQHVTLIHTGPLPPPLADALAPPVPA